MESEPSAGECFCDEQSGSYHTDLTHTLQEAALETGGTLLRLFLQCAGRQGTPIVRGIGLSDAITTKLNQTISADIIGEWSDTKRPWFRIKREIMGTMDTKLSCPLGFEISYSHLPRQAEREQAQAMRLNPYHYTVSVVNDRWVCEQFDGQNQGCSTNETLCVMDPTL